MCDGRDNAVIPDFRRMLGNRHIHEAGVDVVDDRGRGVEGHNPDRAGLAGLLHAIRGTQRREQVGAEHALQVSFTGEDALKLRGGLVGIVVVELGFQNGDVREFLGHGLLEAGFALIGGRNARLHVRNIDLAFAADGRGQGARGNLAAQHVVRCNVGQREVGIAGTGLVLAGPDEGVDGDHRDTRIMRLAQRLDQLGGVGRRDQDRIGGAGDDGIQHRHLGDGVEVGGTLEHQFHAQRVGGSLCAFLHGDVEGVRGQAGDQGDGEFLVLRMRSPKAKGQCQGRCRGSAQK